MKKKQREVSVTERALRLIEISVQYGTSDEKRTLEIQRKSRNLLREMCYIFSSQDEMLIRECVSRNLLERNVNVHSSEFYFFLNFLTKEMTKILPNSAEMIFNEFIGKRLKLLGHDNVLEMILPLYLRYKTFEESLGLIDELVSTKHTSSTWRTRQIGCKGISSLLRRCTKEQVQLIKPVIEKIISTEANFNTEFLQPIVNKLMVLHNEKEFVAHICNISNRGILWNNCIKIREYLVEQNQLKHIL